MNVLHLVERKRLLLCRTGGKGVTREEDGAKSSRAPLPDGNRGDAKGGTIGAKSRHKKSARTSLNTMCERLGVEVSAVQITKNIF